MNCHGECTLQAINKRVYFLNSCRISGYFETKFTTIAQIEHILQESEDLKMDNILNLERVYFLVTRVISVTDSQMSMFMMLCFFHSLMETY